MKSSSVRIGKAKKRAENKKGGGGKMFSALLLKMP